MSIKVKPVRWRGWDFLSSTEARWAQFFRAVNVSFAYEPGTADCNDGDLFYKSDFWVPAYNSFVEIKGASPVTPKALKKAATLCAETGNAVRILVGDPLECSMHYFHFVPEAVYCCLKSAFDPLIAQNPARIVDITEDGFVEHIYSDAPIWCPQGINDSILIPLATDDESFDMFDGKAIEFSAMPSRDFWEMWGRDHVIRGWGIAPLVFVKYEEDMSQADINEAFEEERRIIGGKREAIRKGAKARAENVLTVAYPRLMRAMRTARMSRFR